MFIAIYNLLNLFIVSRKYENTLFAEEVEVARNTKSYIKINVWQIQNLNIFIYQRMSVLHIISKFRI